MASNKVARRPNWSNNDIALIVDAIVTNIRMVDGKFGEGITHKVKDEFWADLAEKVKSVSGIDRSADEVQKKWRDLKSQTKKKIQTRRKEMSRTGGGGELPPMKDWEEKIESILPTEIIIGIDGGVETGENINNDVETRISDEEVIIHPSNVEVEVVRNTENEQETVNETKIKRRRTSQELLNNQVMYFEQQAELASIQIDYFKQRTRTERIREEYFQKAVDALEKGQSLDGIED